MKAYKYIITSGWWCDDDTADDRESKYGAPALRKREFFYIWYDFIKKFTNPEKILIIDSGSPIKPSLESLENVHFISLDYNPGHSTRSAGKYSGVTYAHILGMIYTLLENVDYWVYVEQDALISGRGIVEYAISNMSGGIMFGSGKGTPQPMQQSFMIFHKKSISDFLKNLDRIRYRDCEVSPEMKFAIAASPLLSKIPNAAAKMTMSTGFIGKIFKRLIFTLSDSTLSGFQALPFGYGRKRPINHCDNYYYFQHGSERDVQEFYVNQGLRSDLSGFLEPISSRNSGSGC